MVAALTEPEWYVVTLIAGMFLGVIAVKFLLPRLGEAVGRFFYSSGEKVGKIETDEAAALLARGDFEGAIRVFERRLQSDPPDMMAIKEIARIRSEHLLQPEEALRELDAHLMRSGWSDDDRAFLRFRKVDVMLKAMADVQQARVELESIMEAFPSSRHAANARHRLHELKMSN